LKWVYGDFKGNLKVFNANNGLLIKEKKMDSVHTVIRYECIKGDKVLLALT